MSLNEHYKSSNSREDADRAIGRSSRKRKAESEESPAFSEFDGSSPAWWQKLQCEYEAQFDDPETEELCCSDDECECDPETMYKPEPEVMDRATRTKHVQWPDFTPVQVMLIL